MNAQPDPRPRFSMSCTLRVHEKCVVSWCNCPCHNYLPLTPARSAA